MKHTILLLLFFVAGYSSHAQENCEFVHKYTIAAESGMKMRSQPTTNSTVVTYVMADSIVEVCAESFGEATIEDTTAHWRKVNYKGAVGYMFDGFLAPLHQVLPAPVLDSTEMAVSSLDSTLTSIDSTQTQVDSTLSHLSSTTEDTTAVQPLTPAEPAWTWVRTERDSIPSTGRLDRVQIRTLATALRGKDLKMDSLIGVLHKLPTKGKQDSVIAWIDAGMPGGIVVAATPAELVRPATATPTTTPVKPVGPPPYQIQLATEAYNFCGDIGTLDPSLNWYGLFPDEYMGNYRIKRVDLEIVVSKTKLGNSMEFDIRNSSGQVAHFLFGVNRSLDTNKIYQLAPDYFATVSPKLFPGQQIQAFAQYDRPSAANVFISATGSVIEVGACPVIENYSMKINSQGPYGEINQNITELFPSLGECGMPDLYWFGDLNGDNYPELLFVAPDKNKNEFTLLLSNVNLEEGLYELGSTWTLESCR